MIRNRITVAVRQRQEENKENDLIKIWIPEIRKLVCELQRGKAGPWGDP